MYPVAPVTRIRGEAVKVAAFLFLPLAKEKDMGGIKNGVRKFHLRTFLEQIQKQSFRTPN
jgi:hypothetical protein